MRFSDISDNKKKATEARADVGRSSPSKGGVTTKVRRYVQNIDKLLEEIRDGIDLNYAERDPSNMNHGHVGDLADYHDRLKDIRDSVMREGEYHPDNVAPVREEDIKKPHPKLQAKVKELMAKGYDRRQAIRKAEELTGMKNESTVDEGKTKRKAPKARSAEARAAWEMGKQSGGAHDEKKYTKKDRSKNKVTKRDVEETAVAEKEGGMSDKERKAYNREHGSNLKRAQPSGGKRRTSYCARSKGQMDDHNISCRKTPDKPICKARRDWNC